jgi:fructokinase
VGFAERETGMRGTIGVVSLGAISTLTGAIKNSNSVGLNGKPLNRDLAERLGREIRLENDANCFALSEAVDGSAAGAGVTFGVILGTGVGGGLVVDKTLCLAESLIECGGFDAADQMVPPSAGRGHCVCN